MYFFTFYIRENEKCRNVIFTDTAKRGLRQSVKGKRREEKRLAERQK